MAISPRLAIRTELMGVCFGVDEEEATEEVEVLEGVVVDRKRGRGFKGRRRFARSVERMMGD
jgi:hypothetical protein